jgi:hypothetical protein
MPVKEVQAGWCMSLFGGGRRWRAFLIALKNETQFPGLVTEHGSDWGSNELQAPICK